MEMIVYYRMCDVKSGLSKKSPIHPDNNYELAKMCLKSFVDVYKLVKPHVVFICDHCPLTYDKMIREVVPFDHTITHTAMGINETCLYQYRLYEQSKEDVVMFLEYDYLWANVLIPEDIQALGLVTPYDHPDKYPTDNAQIIIVNNKHYRSTVSTTATFATTRKLFMKHKDILYKHGYIDHARWLEITDTLYSPIPSCATHMVRDYMAPRIAWHDIADKYA